MRFCVVAGLGSGTYFHGTKEQRWMTVEEEFQTGSGVVRRTCDQVGFAT